MSSASRWRDHQAHAPTPQGQTGDAAGGQGEAGAGEVTGSPAVNDGRFETGHKKVPDEIIPTRAVTELEWEVRQIAHWVGDSALSKGPDGGARPFVVS